MAERPAMRRIDAIRVGVRHRRDLGDLASLAKSIGEVGLLHPIVVRRDGRLIAGERRLEAFKLLGRTEIPATVVDLEEIARGELAENADRKDFLPSEIDAIRRALEPREKAAAKARETLGKISPGSEAGRTRDRVGAFAGVSGRTVEKIAAIVKAAEAEPETFGRLRDAMDRTGRVEAPYRRLRAMRQSIAIRAEPPPLPGNGPYRVAAVDPPWPYDAQPTEQQNSRAVRPYPTMTIEAICALAVASIMHDHSIVWLWVDNYHLLSGDALRVLAAWGFKPVTLVTWAKDRMGLGHWLRGQTEHCIMATRGKPTVFLTDESTLLFAPVGAHSEKPDAFYALVERLCPAPRYCELFARRRRPNWDAHGDEIEAAPALAGELAAE